MSVIYARAFEALIIFCLRGVFFEMVFDLFVAFGVIGKGRSQTFRMLYNNSDYKLIISN